MIQTDTDYITLNEKNNFSSFSSEPQPIKWTNSSFTPIHTIDRLHTSDDSSFVSDTLNLSSSNNNNNTTTEEDNIDWEYVSKQLEKKLQTSTDIISSQSDESYNTKLPPKIPKKYRFRPIINHGSTVTQKTSTSSTTTSQNDNYMIFQSILSNKNQNIISNETKFISDHIKTDTSIFSNKIDHTSTLHKLFNELIECQEKQAFLLKQIQQLINQSEQTSSSTPSSSTFFLPLNTYNDNSNNIPSLQDAFQQRKSSFIQHSQERVNQIYRQNNKYHHRIIPNIKQTNNTYLQKRRQYENDRLCTMIIKHQNRQSAKIYGNLIKNHLYHN